jgi:glycine oxidase
MSGSASLRVIVVGAGAFGASIALKLAQIGAQVTLIDPAALGDNASGVAAGMLAPAFEALLDPPSASHFPFLRAARDLWPGFVRMLGEETIGFQRSGGLWVDPADPGGLDRRLAGLEALGADARRIAAHGVLALAPRLSAGAGEGVFTSEDWRLNAGAALRAILAAAVENGVRTLKARVAEIEPGRVILENGEWLAADSVVVATGAGPALTPEAAHLAPIKGQILTYPVAWPAWGPAVRGPGGYGLIGADGVVVGATMQAGRRDRDIELDAVADLAAWAVRLFPELALQTPRPAAGVRATTPDGLPLLGTSAIEGVYMAAGARRNGWLLAPLAAATITAYLTGADPGPWAGMLDARRFDR